MSKRHTSLTVGLASEGDGELCSECSNFQQQVFESISAQNSPSAPPILNSSPTITLPLQYVAEPSSPTRRIWIRGCFLLFSRQNPPSVRSLLLHDGRTDVVHTHTHLRVLHIDPFHTAHSPPFSSSGRSQTTFGLEPLSTPREGVGLSRPLDHSTSPRDTQMHVQGGALVGWLIP